MAEAVIRKRRIIWEGELPPAPSPPPVVTVQKDTIVEPKSGSTMIVKAKPTMSVQKRSHYKRLGNGHKSEKTRDLLDHERDIIREGLFLPKNGQIDRQDCVVFRNARINDIAENSAFNTIAIFQITGYVSVLHTMVAEGRLTVSNLVNYEQWMRTKYGETLWARYNQSLYVSTRVINAGLIAQGQQPTQRVLKQSQRVAESVAASVQNIAISLSPAFTAFPKRYARA